MKRWSIIGVILAITFSTLFIEVLLTRVFSVVYFGHTAFLIISLALFGYGISGVYLAVSKLTSRPDSLRYLERFLLLFAVSFPVIFKLTLLLRIDFLHLFHPATNFLYLILTFLLLLLPFFFGGVSLALIFSLYSREIGKLYFVDLLGAGLGSLAVIPLIPLFGPTRMLLLTAFLLVVCWSLLAKVSWSKKTVVLLATLLVGGFLFRFEDAVFPIVPKEDKRQYAIQKKNKRIEYHRWSTINMIDVAPWPLSKPPRKVIWINGGTMSSQMYPFDGNVDSLLPIRYNHNAYPYLLTRSGTAMIIGSAGGFEVMCALSHGFKWVVAVEMDPVICSLLKKEYADYCGRMFHLPQVTLIADEGRSVVQRLKTKFDVIQMVNSHNTDSLLSGAMSVSESYIYTVEAFKDYWNRLNDDGFLYIVHWNGERMFATALQALRELGVPAPEKKIFVIEKNVHLNKDGFNFFFMKKGDLAAKDFATLTLFSAPEEVVYSPDRRNDNLYRRIVDNPEMAIRGSAVDISPTRDRSPYFNQASKIGQFRLANYKLSGVFTKGVVQGNLVFSNSIYLSILGLSILFSLLLIYLPLRASGARMSERPLILYFFLIGIAFIIVEIITIKIFQLFLGSPAVTISIIIFALLISSGFGSLLSQTFDRWFRGRSVVVFAVVLCLLLVVYAFFLFGLLNALLALPMGLRLAVTCLLLFLPGLMMGSFFPWGIRFLGERNREAIGWAWGANAFATVFGSILAVIVSINWNFTVTLLIAALCYLAAGWVARWRLARES